MSGSNIQQGIITRIYLKNFVTYDEVTVKPGRNLNLIIGANGTGKSTIVSAIVLGLGGIPSVIGRGSHVRDYVKAGHTKATIEIDLQSGPNKYVTITRNFDAENHTTWMVNKKTVNGKQITDLMKGFNIQVDNLCQFLPQDKVQEFSKMTPAELLKETQRSVGDPKLLEHHEKLKELRKKQADLEKELARFTLLLNESKQTYDALKDSVGHINEQKQVQKKLKTLKQKKAWLLYQEKRVAVEQFEEQSKKEKDAAQKKRDKIEKKLRPIKEEINKLKSSISSLEKTAKQNNSETAAKNMKLKKFMDDIDKYEKSIDDIETRCENRIKQEQESDERINQQMQQKNKMENDLQHIINEVGTVEKLTQDCNLITPKMNEHKSTFNALKRDQDLILEKVDSLSRRIRVGEQNLQAVQDIENKRLEMLQRMSNDAYKGVMWLRTNRHLFNHPIHEPMVLTINLKDAKYSKYFENVIPQRDLTAFVCEDKNDMNTLIRYLRDQQKLKINAVHSDPNRNVNFEPHIPLHNIQRFGFEHYMISLIDAPRTVLNYIVHNYAINKIPIGNDSVAANLDRLPKELFRFFSATNAYSVSHSKYTGEKSTRQSAVSSRDILSITIDTNRVQYIQKELNVMHEQRNSLTEELKTFEEKFAKVNEKINTTKAIKQKLEKDIGRIKTLQMRISMSDKSIDELQRSRKSIDEIRAEHKAEVQSAILKQLQAYDQYNRMLDDCYKNIVTTEEMKLQIKIQKNSLAVKENDSQNLREEFDEAERDYKRLEADLAPLKRELLDLYNAAKLSTGGLDYNEDDFAPIKRAFSRLPQTIEEIFQEIQITQAKIFCLNNDPEETNRILSKFNNAKKNVEDLNGLIKEKEEELNKSTENIEKIRNEWLPMLELLVEKINTNFSNYFSRMKCAGELSLTHGENPLDFETYGLTIKVKFRDADELQVLTRNHQSGGERAVTTAVYMIALQELTRVPFRCVDEINQGMDATNERRVFELIVNITGSANSSQYFLLTPKLLPGLKYNETVTVLTVFNGTFMVPCSKFDIEDKCNDIIQTVIRRRSAVH